MGNLKDELRKIKAKLRKESGGRDESADRPEESKATPPGAREEQGRGGKRSGKTAPKSGGRRKSSKTPAQKARAGDTGRSYVAIHAAHSGRQTPQRSQRYPAELDQLEAALLTSADSTALSDEQDFKDPDPWVAAGFVPEPAAGRPRRVLSVRIGLDFGTAFTKVALRFADQLSIVDWYGLIDTEDHHFLPGEVSEERDGSLRIGRSPTASEVHSSLKLPFLLEEDPSWLQQALAVGFLAKVLAYTRAWFHREHESLASTRRVAWSLNIGLPANSWRDDGRYRRFERLAAAAWSLSWKGEPITVGVAIEALELFEAGELVPELDELGIVPELTAQVATYANSPQRQYGLHFLVDIGAGTADQAVFSVHRARSGPGHACTLWSTRVRNLGTHYLAEWRMRRVPACSGGDLSTRVRTGPADELAAPCGAPEHEIAQADTEFSLFYGLGLARSLKNTRGGQGLNREPEWSSGLRTFLCGGGSLLDPYVSAVRVASEEVGTSLPTSEFPKASVTSTHLVPEDQSHRFSVAYGLTFDLDTIGELLTDPPPPPRNPPLERPDHREIYGD